ncbi:MAG: DUF2189 domain-containing protein [Amaricoccus sp.]
MTTTIGNPLSWSVDAAKAAGQHLGSVAGHIGSEDLDHLPQVRRIEISDLRTILRQGMNDFAACRSDVMALCLLYPIIGLAIAWIAFDRDLMPLLFPAVSGFALLGPVAGVGLYEMSRRREQGLETGWGDAFSVLRSANFGAILALGLLLFAIFLAWMITAASLNNLLLGPDPRASFSAYLGEVLSTGAGWALIVAGCGIGLLFAALVLMISVVSFPLLLDRDVGIPVAIATSMRVAAVNPGPIAAWGLIVAAGLVLGSVPLFLGLILVLPVLGHATWHLYRATVVPGR